MATSWRLAKSLETLRSQVNEAYPKRSKASDGTIGDTSHQATASDHNPNVNGVVTALDLTHDPKNGFDAHELAERLRSNRHPNLRYIISNARIAGWWTDWKWQPSSGHKSHIHVSVGTLGVGDGQTYDRYDSSTKWDISSKEEIMLSTTLCRIIVRVYCARPASKEELKKYVGKVTADDFVKNVKTWPDHKRTVQSAQGGDIRWGELLLDEFRKYYVVEQVTVNNPDLIERIAELEADLQNQPVKTIEVVKGDEDRTFGDLITAAFAKLFRIK